MNLPNANWPTLEELQLFVRLHQAGSMTQCADELGVSVAYISKRLRQLEERLGLKLVHRTTRKLLFTEAGEHLRMGAHAIAGQVDALFSDLEQLNAEPQGLLKLCSSSGFGRNQIAPVITQFARQYPSVQVEFDLLDRSVDLMEEGYHLDIRLGQVQEPQLIVEKIFSNQRFLCAAPAYIKQFGRPTKIEDLAKHACLLIRERDQPPGVWALQGPEGLMSCKVNGQLISNNGEVVKRWMLDGLGIGLRSQWDVQDDLRNQRLVRVMPKFYQNADVHALYSSKLSNSKKVRAFIECLKHHLFCQTQLSMAS